MTPWPDTQNSLIHRLANASDRSAWEQFEQCYQSAVYRLARSRGLQADDALDVVQEVMMAVHRLAASWHPSEHAGSFRAWLAETTRRQTLAHLRFRSRIGETFDFSHEMIPHGPATPLPNDAQEEQDWLFYEAIAHVERSCNPSHWMAFWMTSIQGIEAAEVATRLGIRLGSVYSIKSRVLAAIKQRIEDLKTQGSEDPNKQGQSS